MLPHKALQGHSWCLPWILLCRAGPEMRWDLRKEENWKWEAGRKWKWMEYNVYKYKSPKLNIICVYYKRILIKIFKKKNYMKEIERGVGERERFWRIILHVLEAWRESGLLYLSGVLELTHHSSQEWIIKFSGIFQVGGQT